MEEKKVTFDATKFREQFEKLRMFNSEFLVYVATLLVAMIVIAISDVLTISSWFEFYLVATAAYLLSRGIAKAHNVEE